MSKLKSPQDKKKASLQHDCRNSYGENDKSSRKNIPQSKQRSHRAERRAANSSLVALKNKVEIKEETATTAEQQAKDRSLEHKRKSFKKRPDGPLRSILEYQRTGRWPTGRPR
jgi:hypothetical protein